MFFCNKRFYPQNFIIENTDYNIAQKQSEEIALEAKEIAPDVFMGTSSVFEFQLRYCLPYETKSFKELKRLQYYARLHTRFQDEYYGYILIDISEWEGHLDEHLFADVTLSFLAYMSDCWKYIFYSKSSLKSAEYKIITKYMWVYRIQSTEKKETKGISIIHDLKKNYKVYFDAESSKKFQYLLSHYCKDFEVINETLSKDMYMYFGSFCSIGTDDLISYIIDSSTYLHQLFDENALGKIVEEMGDLDHGI